MRELAGGLQVAGALCGVAAAWLLAPWCGFLASGVWLCWMARRLTG